VRKAKAGPKGAGGTSVCFPRAPKAAQGRHLAVLDQRLEILGFPPKTAKTANTVTPSRKLPVAGQPVTTPVYALTAQHGLTHFPDVCDKFAPTG
jgi:hypothetical protein